ELSSEVSGTVKSVLVSENDLIKQGETLLVLDTTTLEAQVAQAQANEVAAQAAVKQSEVSLSEAKNKYLRTKELYVSGTVSQDSLDTLESTYLRAQSNLVSSLAQLDQVRAGLRLQQDSLRKATVIAPLDGVVLQREIDPGQTVVASLQAPTLFVLAKDLTHMELYLNVDEADIGKISQNMMAEFTVDAYPDQLFTAKISKVHLSPQTVDGVVTYETHLCVDNPHNILRPGMTATADIIVTEVSDALLLPNSALRYRPAVIQEEEVKSVMSQLFPRPKSSESSKELQKDESNTVWVLRGGKEVQVAVEVGMTDGIHTEIKGGDLLKSDQVIIGRIKTQGN
ncbi:MAG: efflux RND transporter periplasmic adaptor subunit, partial [Pseudomonadota bacterium]|nr:efflux RND transporter periplasmic adaptor subunit [Pseudomonadota bacterium]